MISIIVLTFGTKDYIEETLLSFVNQTNKSFEVLLMAHKKDTEVLKILESYTSRYSFLKVLVADEDKGLGHDRNTGIQASQYPYLHFMDGDDLLYPTFIDDYIRTIQEQPEIDIFTGPTLYFNDSDWKKLKKPDMVKKMDAVVSVSRIFQWKRATVTYHSKVYKKSFFISRGLFFPDFRLAYDDFALYQLILFQTHPVSFFNIQTSRFYTLYRNREGSTVNEPVKGSAGYISMVNYILDYQNRTNNLNITEEFYSQYIGSFAYLYKRTLANKLPKKDFRAIQKNKEEWMDTFLKDQDIESLKSVDITHYVLLSRVDDYKYVFLFSRINTLTKWRQIYGFLSTVIFRGSFLRLSFYPIMTCITLDLLTKTLTKITEKYFIK